MYPFINLWWQHIEMTGLWVIVGIIIFCLVCYSYAKKMNLIFSHLFYFLPTMMIVIYFFGSYGWFILRSGHLVPYSIIELSQIIVPPNFNFHAAGLCIGIIFSILLFLYKLPTKTTRKKWVDSLSIAYMISLIVVGIFFVLGDHMIGIPTTSTLGVYALTPFSEVSKFTSVYPVWLFMSIAALVSYLITLLIFKQQVSSGRGFWTFGLFFFLLAIVLLFQNYSRHGVISINDLRIDINQYILVSLSILSSLWYFYNYKKYALTQD